MALAKSLCMGKMYRDITYSKMLTFLTKVNAVRPSRHPIHDQLHRVQAFEQQLYSCDIANGTATWQAHAVLFCKHGAKLYREASA